MAFVQHHKEKLLIFEQTNKFGKLCVTYDNYVGEGSGLGFEDLGGDFGGVEVFGDFGHPVVAEGCGAEDQRRHEDVF